MATRQAEDGKAASGRPLWSVRTLSRRLGLHLKTTYSMIARGELDGVVIRLGGRLRFDPEDVERWLSERKKAR